MESPVLACALFSVVTLTSGYNENWVQFVLSSVLKTEISYSSSCKVPSDLWDGKSFQLPMGLLPERLLGAESGDVLGMVAGWLWHLHCDQFHVVSWHWELHIPRGILHEICRKIAGWLELPYPAHYLWGAGKRCSPEWWGWRSQWGCALPHSRSRGLAYHPFHGTCDTGTI